MANKLTITFSIDNDWTDISTGKTQIADEQSLLEYAMFIVSQAMCAGEFENAELNGELLVSRDGKASEEVQQLGVYNLIMKNLS